MYLSEISKLKTLFLRLILTNNQFSTGMFYTILFSLFNFVSWFFLLDLDEEILDKMFRSAGRNWPRLCCRLWLFFQHNLLRTGKIPSSFCFLWGSFLRLFFIPVVMNAIASVRLFYGSLGHLRARMSRRTVVLCRVRQIGC